MITIIGDTTEELIQLQDLIETGILNIGSAKMDNLECTFELSSGDLLLYDQYKRIIGSKKKG
jgi:hypothetical protein